MSFTERAESEKVNESPQHGRDHWTSCKDLLLCPTRFLSAMVTMLRSLVHLTKIFQDLNVLFTLVLAVPFEGQVNGADEADGRLVTLGTTSLPHSQG